MTARATLGRPERIDGPQLTAFQALYDFGFDEFQLAACRALEGGHGVLVAAPTGSGKTVIGEFAVHLALAAGRKCFYTTPIKALSNQKHADLVRRYGPGRVGLLTGDTSVNGEAPVVVMTTEVLRNMLYAGSPTLSGLGYVVLDEVHYLADTFRGAVWEEVIISLPESVQLAALSATVSNAEEFGDWMTSVRGGTTVIVDEHRPVPLWQHMLAGNRLYDLFAIGAPGGDGRNSGEGHDHQPVVNPELARLARHDSRDGRSGTVPHGRRGRAGASGAARRGSGRPAGAETGRARARFTAPRRADAITQLDRAGLLPAIDFIFSRAGCDAAVEQCLKAGLRLTTPAEAERITGLAAQRTAGISAADLAALGHASWLAGLQRGIAAHHAGMIPAFKETVEEAFTAGLVRVVFATETLALGINMPARTVVIERLDKWNGEAHAALTAGEYTQLTGRAGRRGIDVEGHAVVLWQPGIDPDAVAGLAGTRTYQLSSSFRPSYNMAVNLIARSGRKRASAVLESSFAQFQANRAAAVIARRALAAREAMTTLAASCDRGDFAEYAGLRAELSRLETSQSRQRSATRRAAAVGALAGLRRGDIIVVRAGRRAGAAVVLLGGGDPRAPMPLVLTEERRLRRLTVADCPDPVQTVDRIRIPGSFVPRSPQHRKDLASTVRNKLAGRDLRQLAPRGANGSAAAADDAAIASLRRQLRAHPCHRCPDAPRHASDLDRYLQLEKQAAALERQLADRTHVIARTFDRVCSVLTDLGYLDGDEVTAGGRMLAGLYAELDLLAAECLRRGTWDGLGPAELAACVSALSYESRGPDDAGPPRLPGGRVREVLGSMAQLWAELDSAEREHRLDFLREPDPGFAWAAHAWAQGQPLERLLTGELTAGDFVRSVKQLADLLDQIAAAAAGQPLARTARSAIAALRRGVVTASAAS